jgi:serine phosphatase RsbU (regulator of sigma subunit)/anti-sigma regulatory factor (Ser/Thr protein kinase)
VEPRSENEEPDLARSPLPRQAAPASVPDFFAPSSHPPNGAAAPAARPAEAHAPSTFTPGAAFTPSAYASDVYTDAFTPNAFTSASYTPGASTPDAHVSDTHIPGAHPPDAYAPEDFTSEAYTSDAFTTGAFASDAFIPNTYVPDARATDVFDTPPHAPGALSHETFTPGGFDSDVFHQGPLTAANGVAVTPAPEEFAPGVFSPARIAACAAEITRAVRPAAADAHWCAETAAQWAVATLRAAFPGEDGESALVLVRIFQTCVWEALTAQLRSFVLARMDGVPAAGPIPDPGSRANLATIPCLALMATAGERPSWSDRRASHNHQALPLNGPEVLERAPLVLTVLGDLVGAGGVQRDPGQPQVAVHPVPKAAGSPLVPAQGLIDRHSVTAALGLGGMLPTGEAFTAVLFSRAPLPAGAAADFAPIALALHALLAPLAAAPLFEPAGPVGRVLPHEEEHRPSAPRPLAGDYPGQYLRGDYPGQFLPGGGPGDTWGDGRGDGWSVKPRSSVEAALRDHRTRLAQESKIIETLYSVGQTLAKQLDLGKLVRSAIEAATSVVGARFGAFVYTVREADGQSETRYALAGLPPDSFEQFPIPRAAAQLTSGTLIHSPIRLADVTQDFRRGQDSQYAALPSGSSGSGEGGSVGGRGGANQGSTGTVGGAYPGPGHQGAAPANPPVRSYLAVPVTAADGEILGSFYFGHPDVGVFTERDEQLAKGVAAHAASAMDNARLYRRERATAMALQTSLLPTTPAQVGDLEVASTYLPGEQGSRVGGDWFDVIALSADRVALVIGDVMGRGIDAAAVMGQLRAAIQAYAVMDLPPAQILDQLNRLVCQLHIDQIATCVYAVFDPSEGTLRWSNAGHLPPLLTDPEGQVTLLEADLGMPLGVDQAVFSEAVRPLPPGSRLLLYTDGLVECRDQSLVDRLGELREVLTELSAPGVVVGAQESCKHLINTLLTGAEHDDVAVLLITVLQAQTRTAQLELEPTLEAARKARGFIRETLTEWQAEDSTDLVISVASELVNNAAEHAGTPLALRLRQREHSILIEVSDGDGRLVRPTPADLNDERHRGLVIVSTLATRWGVRPTDKGKTVWAELPAG